MSVCEFNPVTINSLYHLQAIEPSRLALVDRFYRSQGYKVKCAQHERVFVLSSAHELIAAVRFVPQLSGHYWLRNLLVDPDLRGYGLASRLLNETKTIISPAGCYCFALPHLKDFYLRMGFESNPIHCPPDIVAMYEKYRSRGRDWVLMGYK